jgi:ubiquitin C-terminal hydrolase
MKTVVVDCSCNVTRIFEGLLLHEYQSASHEKECPVCNFRTKRTCPILPLNILILAEEGLTELERAATSMLIEKTNSSNHQCSEKMALITERCNIIDHLIFFEISSSVKIADIPNTINMIQSKKYGVVSAIEYIPGGVPGGLGHYKAHCRSGNKWYCYDDLAQKVTKTNINKNIQIDVLIYAKI